MSTSEIQYVLQQHNSIRDIYLIITKLENHIDRGPYNNTTIFLEDMSPYMMKIRSINLLCFFMAAELTGIGQVFQQRISIRIIDLIITKLKNNLRQGYYHSISKFHEHISPFRMKMRSFNFAIFLWPPNLLGFNMFFKSAFL